MEWDDRVCFAGTINGIKVFYLNSFFVEEHWNFNEFFMTIRNVLLQSICQSNITNIVENSILENERTQFD